MCLLLGLPLGGGEDGNAQSSAGIAASESGNIVEEGLLDGESSADGCLGWVGKPLDDVIWVGLSAVHSHPLIVQLKSYLRQRTLLRQLRQGPVDVLWGG